ncbi:MAG TPA: hypothetical protein VIM12_19515 [Noviherbaspirillum sp.]|jgi:hypothetical protein
MGLLNAAGYVGEEQRERYGLGGLWCANSRAPRSMESILALQNCLRFEKTGMSANFPDLGGAPQPNKRTPFQEA